MIGPTGSYIVFACGIGETVKEMSKNDRNGILTEHLLQHIATDLTIEAMFDRVCCSVSRETNGITHISSGYYSSVFSGYDLNQLNCPSDVIVDEDNGCLIICDRDNRRYQIDEYEGIIVAGSNGRGNRLDQLNEPRYIFVHEDRFIYISYSCNPRVVKWTEGATHGIIVAGGNGKENALNQLSHPQGIVVNQRGTIYIADGGNQRIQSFEIEIPIDCS